MNSSLECIARLQQSKAALMMLSEDPPLNKGHSECLPTATALPLIGSRHIPLAALECLHPITTCRRTEGLRGLCMRQRRWPDRVIRCWPEAAHAAGWVQVTESRHDL